MDKRALIIANQRNKVTAMETKAKKGEFRHPHDAITYRMSIIIERAKLGMILTDKN